MTGRPENQDHGTFTAFASVRGELRRLSAWVGERAAAACLDAETSYRIELCLNEAAANIILHGYRGGDAVGFDVEFHEVNDRVRITLIDGAPPFNPLQDPPLPEFKSIDEVPQGGFGIHLLRACASAVDYRREADREHAHSMVHAQRTLPGAAQRAASIVARADVALDVTLAG